MEKDTFVKIADAGKGFLGTVQYWTMAKYIRIMNNLDETDITDLKMKSILEDIDLIMGDTITAYLYSR